MGIENDYYNWLLSFIDDGSHRYLLSALYNKEFTYFLAMDGNRAEDGIALRNKFEREQGYSKGSVVDYLKNKPCSVLEMMLALSLRCEINIMGDLMYGDRTGVWFWSMVRSLGLLGMTDHSFDPEQTDYILDRFLSRQYDHDGHGGLFIIENSPVDLRSVEIWMQMNWYLNVL